jgi:hypothetical protein
VPKASESIENLKLRSNRQRQLKPVLFAMEWNVQAKAGLDVYFYEY